MQKADKRSSSICGVIMIIATLVALLLLFLPLGTEGPNGFDAHINTLFWLPWPIGGLLCAIVTLLFKLFTSKD